MLGVDTRYSSHLISLLEWGWESTITYWDRERREESALYAQKLLKKSIIQGLEVPPSHFPFPLFWSPNPLPPTLSLPSYLIVRNFLALLSFPWDQAYTTYSMSVCLQCDLGFWPLSNILFLFLINCRCMCLCGDMLTGMQGLRRPEGVLDPLELDLELFVCFLMG